ncbi:hypothetical protein D9M73_213180 [compost metagenome]
MPCSRWNSKSRELPAHSMIVATVSALWLAKAGRMLGASSMSRATARYDTSVAALRVNKG